MGDRFATTRWSIVLAAGGDDASARAALTELCRIYWQPVYTFVRYWRRGTGHDLAQDLTQEFFARLLARGDLTKLERGRARFRSWLLVCVKRFLIKYWRHCGARKRDTSQLDWLAAEEASGRVPSAEGFVDPIDPERAYVRSWTCALLERTRSRLERIYTERGEERLFAQIRHLLVTPPGEPADYAEHAAALGTSADALKVRVHRMRGEFGALLRAELGEVVSRRALDSEIDNLSAAFRGDLARDDL